MAEQLDSFPEGVKRGRPAKYPWDQWANGGIWKITKGEDYETATENMQVGLHVRARELGKTVKTTQVKESGSEGLVFKFTDGAGL